MVVSSVFARGVGGRGGIASAVLRRIYMVLLQQLAKGSTLFPGEAGGLTDISVSPRDYIRQVTPFKLMDGCAFRLVEG
jgi:hypothetical protein